MPECETLQNAAYDEGWVKNILPGSISESSRDFKPEICSRFVKVINQTDAGSCSSLWFGDEQEQCDEWVFDDDERTIVNDVRTVLMALKVKLIFIQIQVAFDLC